MIVDAIVGGLLDLFGLILGLIPDASLPAAAASSLSSFAVEVGGGLGGLDGLLPIAEVATFVGWVLGTYVPIIFAYQLSMWVWTHLPVVGSGT